MKNILLTNQMIKDYTGSELDVCSVGSALVQMGYTVEAATYELGDPLLSEFKDSGILFTDISHADLILKKYDLIMTYSCSIL